MATADIEIDSRNSNINSNSDIVNNFEFRISQFLTVGATRRQTEPGTSSKRSASFTVFLRSREVVNNALPASDNVREVRQTLITLASCSRSNRSSPFIRSAPSNL